MSIIVSFTITGEQQDTIGLPVVRCTCCHQSADPSTIEGARLWAAEHECSPINDVATTIIHLVADRYGISSSDIIGPRRDAMTVEARHVAAYLCWKETPLRLCRIDGVLGRPRHTGIASYAVRKIFRRIRTGDGPLSLTLLELSRAIKHATRHHKTADGLWKTGG